MLSLTALAALPMAGFADATWSVPADKNSVKDWTAAENTKLDSSVEDYLVGFGAGISQDITLVKGTYTVTVDAKKTSNATFTILVGGKIYNPGDVFKLEAETNTVTLKVDRISPDNIFTVGGINVSLIFDFAKTKSNLTSRLDGVKANLALTKSTWKETLQKKAESIEKIIGVLQNGTLANGTESDVYKTYKAQQLYNYGNSKTPSKIEKDIQTLEDCYAVLKAFDGMDEELSGLKAKLEKASDAVKAQYKDTVDKLEKEIGEFKKRFAYTEDNITVNKQEWLDKIYYKSEDGVESGYRVTISTLSADFSSYDAVNSKFNEASTEYDNCLNYLEKSIAGEEYATLLDKAKKALQAEYSAVVTLKDGFPQLGFSNNKDALTTGVEKAVSEMQGVKDAFVDHGNDMKRYFNEVQSDFSTLAECQAQIKANQWNISTQAAEDATQAVKNALEAVMAGATKDALGAFPTNYDELKSAAHTAVSNLKTLVDNAADTAYLTGLRSAAHAAYKAAKGEVAGYKTEDGKYVAASFWGLAEAAIETELGELDNISIDPTAEGYNRTEIEKAIKAVYVKDGEGETATESGSVATYKSKAKAAYDKYVAMKAVIDSWNDEYDKVAEFISTTSLVPYNTTTYGAALVEAKKEIENLESGLNTAVGTLNTEDDLYAHANAMNVLKVPDSKDMPKILSVDAETYNAAKDAHDLTTTIATAKKLAVEVPAMAKALRNELGVRFQKYELSAANIAIYGKHLEDIFGPGLNAGVAKEDNFCGIRQAFYDVKHVISETESWGVNPDGTYTARALPENPTLKEAQEYIIDLGNDRSAFTKISERVAELDKAAAKVAEDFKANNNAYDTFIKNYDEAVKTAKGIKDVNNYVDTNREKEFEGYYTIVETSLKDLKTALDKSKNAETFVADCKDADGKKGFDSQLKDINTAISDYLTKATNAKENLSAYNSLIEAKKALYDAKNVTTPITKAVSDEIFSNFVDNAGRQYYIDYLKDLKKEIEALVSNIDSYYTNSTAKANEAATKAKINEIVANVKAVKTNCADNEKNHTDLVARGKKVEELYIKIYNKIDTKDQTDDKQTYLKRLADIDTDFQTAKKAIETAFGEGKLSNDTKTSQYQTYVTEYNAQTTDINAVYGAWIDKDNGYLASVAIANGEALATIEAAYNAAVNDCIDYINKLKKFFDVDGDANRWNDTVAQATAELYTQKNVLEKEYKKATDAKEALDKENAELEKEDVENAKYFDTAYKYYQKVTDEAGITTESGTIYNAHKAIKDAYDSAVKKLNSSAKETLSNRIEAVEDKIDLIEYQAIPNGSKIYKIYSICFDENGKFSTELLKPYFSEVNNKLASAKLGLDDKELALNYMSKYDSDLKTLETETLPAALDELAKAQYEAWVAELDKLYEELYGNKVTGTEGLFTMCAKDANQQYQNGKTYKETFDAAYEEWQSYVEGYTPKYENSTEEGAVNMSDVAQKFSNFKTDSGYEAFKNRVYNFEQSKVYYEMFMTGAGLPEGSTYTSVNAVQKIINSYSDYASEFIAKASAVTKAQEKLDEAKSWAEYIHSICCMQWNYAYLHSRYLSPAKYEADNLKVTINKEEYNTLLTQLTYLKSDYQQALTEENLTDEAKQALQKEYEPQILKFETSLIFTDEELADTEWDAEGVKTPTHTCNKLLDIQNEIIKARNTLSAGRITGVYNAFMESLESLKKRYDVMAADHEGLYDFMKAGIILEADKTAELKESVETFKANGWLIVQESNLKSQIDTWTRTLTSLEGDVAAAKEKHDADVAARTRLQGELQDIKDHVTNLLENELFQQFDVKDYWSSNYNASRWYENEFIAPNEADINSVPTTEGELKDQDPDNPTKLKDITEYNDYITNFKSISYYNEVLYRYYQYKDVAEYTSVQTTLANINMLLRNVNIVNRDSYIITYSTLNQQARAANDFILNLYINGYTYQDIEGNDIIDETTGSNVRKDYKPETFVGEDVPAAIRIFERILTDAEKLKSDIQKNTYVPGNIDQDENGNVSLSDFAMLQYIILGHEEGVTEVQKAAADLNNDDRVDISDLMKLVQMILTPNAAPAPARVRVAIPHATTDDALSIIVEGEGVHQRIGILLDAEQTYAGCQMDITLPEGVTLAAETTGEMAGALSLLSNDLENGSHRILLSSAEGAGMNTGKGALLWLDVNVDHNYNGEGIVLSNVLFANSYGRAFELAIAAGETTGLSNVSMTQEVKEKIYNVGGILMDGLKRGVNIIRGNDGSSKKVIVK